MCKQQQQWEECAYLLYPKLIIPWNAREGWLGQAALVLSTGLWFQRLAHEHGLLALCTYVPTVGRLRSTGIGWKRTYFVRLAAD